MRYLKNWKRHFEGKKIINGKPVQISAGLIRKARIAEDLGWTCPYTSQSTRPINLVTRYVDKGMTTLFLVPNVHLTVLIRWS